MLNSESGPNQPTLNRASASREQPSDAKTLWDNKGVAVNHKTMQQNNAVLMLWPGRRYAMPFLDDQSRPESALCPRIETPAWWCPKSWHGAGRTVAHPVLELS
jgi:hypothetical protein